MIIYEHIIMTQRLILRPFCHEDIDDLHEILSDVQVNTYLPWFVSQCREDTERFLYERIFPSMQKGEAYFYAIEEKASHRVIGYVDVTDIDVQEKCGDLGYGIHRDYWHQGIATEAAKALVISLKKGGFAYLHATCDRKNKASGKVLSKIGMTYMYSYEEQWQPKDYLVVFRMYQINFDHHQDRIFKKYWDMYPIHYIEEEL